MSFKILSVVGARPNFMKVAAICEAIKWMNSLGAAEQLHHVLVHTGSIMITTCRIRFLTIWNFLSQISAWESARPLIQFRPLGFGAV